MGCFPLDRPRSGPTVPSACVRYVVTVTNVNHGVNVAAIDFHRLSHWLFDLGHILVNESDFASLSKVYQIHLVSVCESLALKTFKHCLIDPHAIGAYVFQEHLLIGQFFKFAVRST